MKKIFIVGLVVLLILAFTTAVFAAEEASSIHLFGSYTIQDDRVFYTIRMAGDPICYLGFSIDSDLEIIEVQTEDTAFSAAHYANNKVICYGMGDVIADGIVITLILAVPEPDSLYSVNLFELEAYNLMEEALAVTTAMPVVKIAPAEPAPTEPAPNPPKSENSTLQAGPNEADSTKDNAFDRINVEIASFVAEHPYGFIGGSIVAIALLLAIPTSKKDDDDKGAGEA